ncbi:hypothetical protein GLAREA_02392 [Glarea lozoyensis ATCC 20868]|uniref:2EXR domain-containing protein n=1 Tax=Glarea lozoyensis (strain ATCC 20868 / MF5171) TaxID=1116229 RepID=S3CMP3_GLAL2|nr:uncharacterized protein GLAREA_02392 [Glarea lozoyensis ATCC 20868]EPE26479.1 hypothetical protein GLAREA_02392 [Glarea lozoyensis ATCC 20868]
MEKDSSMTEVGNIRREDSKAKLPPELRIIIWKNLVEVVPRIVCIRWVSYSHQKQVYSGAKTFESINSYVHPTSLNISPESRQVTSHCYEQILPDLEMQGIRYFEPSTRTINRRADNPPIRFNFEVDTLTFCPEVISTETHDPLPGEDEAGIEARRKDTVIKHMGPAECFEHFRKLLKVPENNLAKVQFLAIGNFSCAIHDYGGDYSVRTYKAGYISWFSVDSAFENLKRLILVVSPWIWKKLPSEFLDLSRIQNQEDVRERITRRYRLLDKTQPNCKIPEIVFVMEDDPTAPRYYKVHTRWNH